MLLIVSLPTIAETDFAARRGDARAQAELVRMKLPAPAADHASVIREALVRVLADDSLYAAVFEAPSGDYVQLAVYNEGQDVRCEALDRDRWESGHMSDQEIGELEASGFTRGDGNFSTSISLDVEDEGVAAVGQLLTKTLHSVYAVDSDGHLSVSFIPTNT